LVKQNKELTKPSLGAILRFGFFVFMLNDKQIRFCEEYIIDLNATQAAIRAKYSKRTAEAQGSRLLRNVKVQEYLQKKKEKIAAKLEISQERTMLEIARVAFQDVRKFYDAEGRLIPIHELSDDAAAAIAGFEVDELFEFEDGHKNKIGLLKKIKRYDKTKALEMLAKHFKIYTDAPSNVNHFSFGYGEEKPV
jgi:phage terminase small subunit